MTTAHPSPDTTLDTTTDTTVITGPAASFLFVKFNISANADPSTDAVKVRSGLVRLLLYSALLFARLDMGDPNVPEP